MAAAWCRSGELTERSLCALAKLCASEDAALAVARLGGVQCALQGLTAVSPNVVEAACTCLWRLALPEVGAWLLASAGGVDALARAMRAADCSSLGRFRAALALAFVLDSAVTVEARPARSAAASALEAYLCTVSLDDEVIPGIAACPFTHSELAALARPHQHLHFTLPLVTPFAALPRMVSLGRCALVPEEGAELCCGRHRFGCSAARRWSPCGAWLLSRWRRRSALTRARVAALQR